MTLLLVRGTSTMTLRIPDTTANARLTGLERFLEFWLGPRRPEYGEPAENLAKIELPGSLHRFYAFAGRWPPAFLPYCGNRFDVQDRFLPLDQGPWGNVYRSGPYLVFVAENQGVWEVATCAQGDDPPVWVSEDCSHCGPSPIWRPLENPLSHFLVTFVLQETLLGSEFRACHEDALSVFAGAGCQCEPVWLNGEYSYPGVHHSYFLVDRRILLRRDTGDIALDDHWYGFNEPAVAEFVEGLNLPSQVG
jgi:hypothetical protein